MNKHVADVQQDRENTGPLGVLIAKAGAAVVGLIVVLHMVRYATRAFETVAANGLL